MKYEVVKYYEVEADSDEKARLIIEELEKKNQQWLFLTRVSSHRTDQGKFIWEEW